jgi:hypothetical protein
VDEWADRYPDRWASICAAAGDVELIERVVVASAVRGAISERRPVRRALIVPLEDAVLADAPCSALAAVLVPPIIWSRDDAIVAAEKGAHIANPEARFRAVERYAATRVRNAHVERVRRHAARLARQLPIEGLPRASEALAEGCTEVREDEPVARDVASVLLASYAMSLMWPPL